MPAATESPAAPEPAAVEKAAAPAASPPPAAGLPPIDEESFKSAHAGPSVRKFARELGVDLGRVRGSGRKGRITADDVKNYVKQAIGGAAAAPQPAGPALPEVPEVDFTRFGAIEVQPLSRVQKISGPRLHASWVNLPHVTQFDEADITALEERRQKLKDKAAKQGARLTPLAFLIVACVHALREFPRFNASLDPAGENLIMKKYFHIGFAADTPNGLVVPVVKDADRKTLLEIARDLADLSGKAREGKLGPADMQGGCFTVSSLGSIGGTAFTPIINAPEVAILGVSRSQIKPVWNGDVFEPRLTLPMSLSYDHRVIDGAEAVRFTRFLAEQLSDPDGLMLS
jgi:pyruvate dehydrogenase E2 component (dihydrolipoamide acetyltransferase)